MSYYPRKFKKQVKTLMLRIDDAAMHATSLICEEDAPRQGCWWQTKKKQQFRFIAINTNTVSSKTKSNLVCCIF